MIGDEVRALAQLLPYLKMDCVAKIREKFQQSRGADDDVPRE